MKKPSVKKALGAYLVIISSLQGCYAVFKDPSTVGIVIGAFLLTALGLFGIKKFGSGEGSQSIGKGGDLDK